MHWLSHFLGLDNLSGPFYGFWSGAGSDISEVTLIGMAVGFWRHKNCHTKGCLRLGKHTVDGTPFVVCARHHPTVPDRGASLDHIHGAHRRADRGATHG